MSHLMPELRMYKHERLLEELNDFMIMIKCHDSDMMKNVPAEELAKIKRRYPKMSLKELDLFGSRLRQALMEQSEPMRKY